MKSINRVIITQDFITLFIFLGILILFFLKAFDHKKLYGYTSAFITQGFIEKTSEENNPFFNLFYILLQFFCVIVISVVTFQFINPIPSSYISNFSLLLLIVLITTLFFVIKNFVTAFIFKLLELKEKIKYLLFTKNGYLYTCCLLLFPFVILHQYAFKSKILLIGVISLLLIFRLFLIFKNNKKTLFRHFFYFILYFCTLELAPLVLLYKTIN